MGDGQARYYMVLMFNQLLMGAIFDPIVGPGLASQFEWGGYSVIMIPNNRKAPPRFSAVSWIWMLHSEPN